MVKRLPFVLYIFSIIVIVFLGGTLTAHFQVFPYPDLRDAGRTLTALIDASTEPTYYGKHVETTTLPAHEASDNRWTILDESVPRLPLIAYGGTNQYLELCPDHGCLAVLYDASGTVTDHWPYRPTDIYDADITGGAYPHELSSFDPRTNVYPVGILSYSDGDILVNFQGRGGGGFPFGMGVARIDSDGMPRWSRFDFSHHWSTRGPHGTAYVPGLKIGDKNISFTLGSQPSRERHTLTCKTGRPQLDTIQVIDGKGDLVEEVELLPIFVNSNWNGLLLETTDECDPLHLNFIDEINDDAGPGLTEGDLVVSLRNLSSFTILDRKTWSIERVVSGGFIQQHSVRHLSDSKFLIFDNRGGDDVGPASRVVELDLVTGRERRIFPNPDSPGSYAQVFSDRAGHLDISEDRTRVLASFTHAGRAFEIDIASGRLLAVYDHLHDLSSVDDVPENVRKLASRFSIYGMHYLK